MEKIKVFRLTNKKYKNVLSGRGAEITGGRWNSKGLPLIYTSESRSLCVTEMAVHLSGIYIPYMMNEIEIAGNFLIKEISVSELPDNWDIYPHPQETQNIGNSFLKESKYLILKVPSVIVSEEFNYLINPNHKDFNLSVSVVGSIPYFFDERFFQKID